MCGAGLEGVSKSVAPTAPLNVEPVIEADPLSEYIEEVSTPLDLTPIQDVDLDSSPSPAKINGVTTQKVEIKAPKKPMIDFDDDVEDDLELDFSSKLNRRKEVLKPKEVVESVKSEVFDDLDVFTAPKTIAKEVEVIEKVTPIIEEPKVEEKQTIIEPAPIIEEPKVEIAKVHRVAEAVVPEISNGKLFGWLVSTSTDNKVIEIREGKFFITRSSLKPTDLVLDDDSISTPHALFFVNIEKGISVQDLVSDSGVFIKKYMEMEFVRIEVPVKLEAGDRIRFGNREFLLAVVPY